MAQPHVWVYGEEDEGFRIHVNIPKLSHHYNKTFGPFTLIFKSWDEVHSFEVEICATAENLPDKIESKIPVKVECYKA
jgi:hypothetical protein